MRIGRCFEGQLLCSLDLDKLLVTVHWQHVGLSNLAPVNQCGLLEVELLPLSPMP
jgi:hypothetical protein